MFAGKKNANTPNVKHRPLAQFVDSRIERPSTEAEAYGVSDNIGTVEEKPQVTRAFTKEDLLGFIKQIAAENNKAILSESDSAARLKLFREAVTSFDGEKACNLFRVGLELLNIADPERLAKTGFQYPLADLERRSILADKAVSLLEQLRTQISHLFVFPVEKVLATFVEDVINGIQKQTIAHLTDEQKANILIDQIDRARMTFIRASGAGFKDGDQGVQPSLLAGLGDKANKKTATAEETPQQRIDKKKAALYRDARPDVEDAAVAEVAQKNKEPDPGPSILEKITQDDVANQKERAKYALEHAKALATKYGPPKKLDLPVEKEKRDQWGKAVASTTEDAKSISDDELGKRYRDVHAYSAATQACSWINNELELFNRTASISEIKIESEASLLRAKEQRKKYEENFKFYQVGAYYIKGALQALAEKISELEKTAGVAMDLDSLERDELLDILHPESKNQIIHLEPGKGIPDEVYRRAKDARRKAEEIIAETRERPWLKDEDGGKGRSASL